MQEPLKKNSDPFIIRCPSQWTSTESFVEKSTLSNNLSLKMGSPNNQNIKKLGFQFQDQDSSSTQSTCQSYPEVASIGDSGQHGINKISVQSGHTGTNGKHEEGSIESTLPMAAQDYAFASQASCGQPYACIPLVYPDPYYRGLIPPYGSQPMIHHNTLTMSITSGTRVPLPLDLAQDEPIYVNAKQYNAILRRRQYRAKLEAQNKLSKPRKPYLHESRHVHALKRARGPGGRFLNTKEIQENKNSASTNGQNNSGSASFHDVHRRHHGQYHVQESYKEGGSMNTCSDITSASNGDNFFHHQELRFPIYHSQNGGVSDSGGTHHYVSVFR